MSNKDPETILKKSTSLLAKEKGFDVPCRNYFNEKEPEEWGPLEGFDHEYWGDNRIVNWNQDVIGIKPFRGFTSAPTNGVLQSWLREKHHIDVIPYPIESLSNDKPIECEELQYSYWVFVKGVKKFVDTTKIFDSYEDAFEYGLVDALNLITV